jgi:hypothetical protein
MSHCNITQRDRYSHTEQLTERIAILEIKNKRLEMLLDEAERNLASIFERVKSGEEVYLCYSDGTRIYLTARRVRIPGDTAQSEPKPTAPS